ncbi:MAG: 50S ribosomal protein L25 [Pseudomonadota bacterium]
MQSIKLVVEPRTATGKGAARKLRGSGRIPAILYRDGGVPTLFSIDPEELDRILHRQGDRNTLFEIDVDGQPRVAMIKEVQLHPVTRRLRHVDFYQVLEGVEVEVKVRLEAVGRAVGTRAGGTLSVLRRELTVRCTPGVIPAVIEVDVTPLKVGDVIRIADIPTPAGVTPVFDANYVVATVEGKRLDDIEADEADEGATEAPAEG